MAFDFGFKAFKASFFDSPAVLKKAHAYQRKTLSKLGAFIRQRVRSSIRKRKKISQPGKPPSSHEGSYKRLIFFAFDAERQSVVVGPVKFKRDDVPRLLEHGGTVVRKGRTLKYRARPHIRPAGEAEARRFPQAMRSS